MRFAPDDAQQVPVDGGIAGRRRRQGLPVFMSRAVEQAPGLCVPGDDPFFKYEMLPERKPGRSTARPDRSLRSPPPGFAVDDDAPRLGLIPIAYARDLIRGVFPDAGQVAVQNIAQPDQAKFYSYGFRMHTNIPVIIWTFALVDAASCRVPKRLEAASTMSEVSR